jgi:hypothetical protein
MVKLINLFNQKISAENYEYIIIEPSLFSDKVKILSHIFYIKMGSFEKSTDHKWVWVRVST